MKLLTILNPEHATEEEVATFIVRTTARAIVYDETGNIGLMYVTNKGYHKLPGGGVEEGENVLQALKRECLEELGCDIEVLGEITTVQRNPEPVLSLG